MSEPTKEFIEISNKYSKKWEECFTKQFGDSDAELAAKDDILEMLDNIFKDCKYARRLIKTGVGGIENNFYTDLLEYWEVCEKAEEQKAK